MRVKSKKRFRIITLMEFLAQIKNICFVVGTKNVSILKQKLTLELGIFRHIFIMYMSLYPDEEEAMLEVSETGAMESNIYLSDFFFFFCIMPYSLTLCEKIL